MVRFYAAEDPNLVSHLKNILVVNHIDCTLVHGKYAKAVANFHDVGDWPEIWLSNPADTEIAQRLIETGLKLEASELLDWQCPLCNEVHASQFGHCWKCGYTAPGE